jgi:hypothetical protein
MRLVFIVLSAAIVLSLSTASQAQEFHVLNCRLMTATAPWLFRQHCKSENFARPQFKKRHALKVDQKQKSALLKKRKLYRKLLYLEKKLYAEWRQCKRNYRCILLVKRKLAKLHSQPSYKEMTSALANTNNSLRSTTSSISNTAGSVTGAAGNTLSGATNTIGGVANSAGGSATNTLGGATDSGGQVVSGATTTVGNTVGRLTK